MIRIHRVPREEMRRAHGLPPEEVRAAERPQSETPPQAKNVREVLDLGTITFISFRGRTFGVPPLPWKPGQDLLDAWLTVRGFPDQLRRGDLEDYYQEIERMTRIMWANTRPLGIFRRLLKRLRLLRNPFRNANEGEIGELAVFFLGRRMSSKSSVRLSEAPRDHRTS